MADYFIVEGYSGCHQKKYFIVREIGTCRLMKMTDTKQEAEDWIKSRKAEDAE